MWISAHKNVINNTHLRDGSPQKSGYVCRTNPSICRAESRKPFQRLRKLALVYEALALAIGRCPMSMLGLREYPHIPCGR
jgi:hypothetical protein